MAELGTELTGVDYKALKSNVYCLAHCFIHYLVYLCFIVCFFFTEYIHCMLFGFNTWLVSLLSFN